MPLVLRRKYYNSRAFVRLEEGVRRNNRRNNQDPNVELGRVYEEISSSSFVERVLCLQA